MIGVWDWRLSGRWGGGDVFFFGWEGWRFEVGLDAYMNLMIPVSYSLDIGKVGLEFGGC